MPGRRAMLMGYRQSEIFGPVCTAAVSIVRVNIGSWQFRYKNVTPSERRAHDPARILG
jgi:hypothetical protein